MISWTLTGPWLVGQIILGGFGVVYLATAVSYWWSRKTRGEYHCSQCDHVSALPED